ncbi:MAG TPA: FAD-dependent oxidoreductase, partial [Acidimicrobiaceae bacterium]|nr:FAD-dependent oxidoreductase [Acidimicrobiaceae bacterium]
MEKRDLLVIGGGPAGAATAIRAARAGVNVTVFEKGTRGRDKVCGDGLTPRAVAALHELEIDMDDAHRIDGLRMIAGTTRRELPWPDNGRFAPHGAVWPRRRLDETLISVAEKAGAEICFETEALPLLDGERVVGVEADGTKFEAPMTVVAAGAPGAVARMLGAERDPNE